eukprot:386934_1
MNNNAANIGQNYSIIAFPHQTVQVGMHPHQSILAIPSHNPFEALAAAQAAQIRYQNPYNPMTTCNPFVEAARAQQVQMQSQGPQMRYQNALNTFVEASQQVHLQSHGVAQTLAHGDVGNRSGYVHSRKRIAHPTTESPSRSVKRRKYNMFKTAQNLAVIKSCNKEDDKEIESKQNDVDESKRVAAQTTNEMNLDTAHVVADNNSKVLSNNTAPLVSAPQNGNNGAAVGSTADVRPRHSEHLLDVWDQFNEIANQNGQQQAVKENTMDEDGTDVRHDKGCESGWADMYVEQIMCDGPTL